MVTGNFAAHHLEPDPLSPDAFRFYFRERSASNERSLVQLHDPSQARLIESRCSIHIVSIQQQTGLEAERIAGAQSRGQQPEGFSCMYDRVPKCLGLSGREVDFKSIFSGISRAGYPRFNSGDVSLLKVKWRDAAQRRVRKGLKNCFRSRALHGEKSGLVADVIYL